MTPSHPIDELDKKIWDTVAAYVIDDDTPFSESLRINCHAAIQALFNSAVTEAVTTELKKIYDFPTGRYSTDAYDMQKAIQDRLAALQKEKGDV